MPISVTTDFNIDETSPELPGLAVAAGFLANQASQTAGFGSGVAAMAERQAALAGGSAALAVGLAGGFALALFYKEQHPTAYWEAWSICAENGQGTYMGMLHRNAHTTPICGVLISASDPPSGYHYAVPDPGNRPFVKAGRVGSNSWRFWSRWQPKAGAPNPAPLAVALPFELASPFVDAATVQAVPSPAVNPNVLRKGFAAPLAQGTPLAEAATGLADPATGLLPSGAINAVSVQITSANLKPPPGPPKPFDQIQPNKNGNKDGKKRTGLQSILRVLNAVSESAEVVDSVYQALPKSVKNKYDCDSKGKSKRGLIDNAGQYGIDGADCKLAAIYNNFHKIDWHEAIKNIIANEIQDKVHGTVYKNVPRNIGHAVDGAMKEGDKALQALLDAVGL